MRWPPRSDQPLGASGKKPGAQQGASSRAVILGFTALGIVLSVLVAVMLWAQQTESARLRLHSEAQVATTAIQQQIDFAIHDLDAIHSLFIASQDVSRDEFNSFVTLHNHSSTAPGLILLQWIPRVASAERAAYEANVRAWGLPGFQIIERDAQGTAQRAGVRSTYFPVTLMWPAKGKEDLLGYDLGSAPTHFSQLQAALDSGQSQIVTTAHDSGGVAADKDVFVVQPVYRTGLEVPPPAQRDAELIGFVVGQYSIDKLVAAALQTLPPVAFDLYLYDETAPAGRQLVDFIPAELGAAATGGPRTHSSGPLLSVSEAQTGVYYADELTIDDRRWLLIAKPAPGAVLEGADWLPAVVLVTGLALTAMVVAYLRKRQEAEQTLRRERTLLRTLLDSIPDLVYYRDTDLRFLGCNHAFEVLHGTSEADLIARSQGKAGDCPFRGDGAATDREVIASGSPQRVRQWLTGEVGVRLLFDTLKTPLYGTNGGIAGVLEISRDVTAMWRSEQALAARVELSDYAQGHSLGELLQQCTDRIEALTYSEIGLFHFLASETGEPAPQAWSTNTLATVCAVEPGMLHSAPSRAGIWSECIRTREPRIYNDVASMRGSRHFPPGHAPVQRFMVAPILRGGVVVAVVGVGNKQTAYGASDLALMLQLAESLWDIVMRKRAEDAVRVSLEKYRVLFGTFPLGITISDKTGALVEANAESERLLGLTVAQHKERTIDGPEWSIIRPDGTPLPAEEFASVRALAENRLVRDVCMGIVKPDQPITWISVTAAPIPLDDYGLAITYRDITDELHMERTQAAQYAVSRILAESPDLDSAAPLVLKSLAQELGWQIGELWWCDEAGERMTLRYQWQALDPALVEFAAASRGFSFTPGLGIIGRVWAGNQPVWIEKRTRSSELPRNELANQAGLQSALAVPVGADSQALGVMAFFCRFERPEDPRLMTALADIGRQIGQYVARKAAEAELRDERMLLAQRVEERTQDLTLVNEQLAHALRAKDEFLANMSHELRTPLHGILTLSETLLDDVRGPMNDSQRWAVTLIEQSGRHLLELINDILDLSKVEADKLTIEPAPVDMMQVCHASVQLVTEMAIKKGVRLAVEVDNSGQKICADERRLRQILVNLLSNGVKFTPGGGNVCLRAVAIPERNEVQFSVADTGIGIAPENLGKLFQPFTQLDASLSRSYEGTGLGLALVRRLVELHGGCVEARSEGIPGRGSEFIVTLPLHQPEMCRPDDDAAPSQAEATRLGHAPGTPHLRRTKVLLAEDNELNRTALGDYLAAAGNEMIYAQNGQEALELAAALHPDIILMDIQMPVLDGLEAIRRLRGDPEIRAIPVIALTALAMVGDRDRCIAAGADDYLDKPVTLRTLQEKIAAILHKPVSQ